MIMPATALRSFTVSVVAGSGTNDLERRAIIAAVFVEIEDQIDDAIASARHIVTFKIGSNHRAGA